MLKTALARLKIGTKVLLIAGIAMLGFAAVLITMVIADAMRGRVGALAQAAVSENIVVQEIAQDFLNARRREKDFLLRKDDKYAKAHAELTPRIAGAVKALLPTATASDAAALNRLQALYQEYEVRFREIAADTIKMGLTPETGLLGRLRAAVHAIETALQTYDNPQLTISMLTMRRHEKDFMARGDKNYLDGLAKEQARFADLLKASSIPVAERTRLVTCRTHILRRSGKWPGFTSPLPTSCPA